MKTPNDRPEQERPNDNRYQDDSTAGHAESVAHAITAYPDVRRIDPDTSTEAAELARRTKYKYAPQVLEILRTCGPRTDHELTPLLSDRLGRDVHGGTVSKTRLALWRTGLATKTDQRRRTPSGSRAIVWRALLPHEPGYGVATEPKRKRATTGVVVASMTAQVVDADGNTAQVRCLSGHCICHLCGRSDCDHVAAVDR